jgi:hypothetical protein
MAVMVNANSDFHVFISTVPIFWGGLRIGCVGVVRVNRLSVFVFVEEFRVCGLWCLFQQIASNFSTFLILNVSWTHIISFGTAKRNIQ